MRKLSVAVICVLMLLSAKISVAGPESDSLTTLPTPKLSGAVSVEQALKERRSSRTLTDEPLTLDEVSQLCWAAQGITDEKGHRTAPSAMATYTLELYLLANNVKGLDPGIYLYEPEGHMLIQKRVGDLRSEFREDVTGQAWVCDAPAILMLSGTYDRLNVRDRADQFTHVEAGLAAQGVFLQATAMGLGSTFIGGFEPEGAGKFLALPENEIVIGVLPVGHRQ